MRCGLIEEGSLSQERIEAIERQIGELTSELGTLRKASEGDAVRNYEFETGAGKTTLFDLFADKDRLLVIHNMGQGCRYCTLWADGFNGLLPHLESALSVVLVSKDPPDVQRTFANSRGWRFRLASHGGGDYIREQGVYGEAENYPGAVVYERRQRRHSSQERLFVRPRRSLLRPMAAPGFGGAGRVHAAVQLLAATGEARGRWREHPRLIASSASCTRRLRGVPAGGCCA